MHIKSTTKDHEYLRIRTTPKTDGSRYLPKAPKPKDHSKRRKHKITEEQEDSKTKRGSKTARPDELL